MKSYLQRSNERRLRLNKERQELTTVVNEQFSIRDALKARLDALNAKKT